MSRALVFPPLAIVALALANALTTTACSADANTCTQLTDKLHACGFTTTEQVDCSRLDASSEDALMQRLDEKGCDGVAQGDTDAVDPRVCALAGWSCPGSPIPAPGPALPRNAVVLVSGIDGSAEFDWNPRVLSALRTAGVDAHHVQVLPWATTPDRGADLWASLQALVSHTGGKVNLICYAVGGIDCRYVASPNGLFKGDATSYAQVTATIASITTVSTPHRGTRVSDAALAALQSGTAADLLQSFVGTNAPAGVPRTRRSSRRSTVSRSTRSTRSTRPSPTRRAFRTSRGPPSATFSESRRRRATSKSRTKCVDSHGAASYMRHDGTNDELNQLLWITSPFASTSRDDQGRVVTSPDDGMVSIESAKWGEFRGCIPADHYDVIGQIGHTTRDGVTGFDAPTFYVWLAGDLARGACDAPPLGARRRRGGRVVGPGVRAASDRARSLRGGEEEPRGVPRKRCKSAGLQPNDRHRHRSPLRRDDEHVLRSPRRCAPHRRRSAVRRVPPHGRRLHQPRDPAPVLAPTKYPVLLVNGIDSSPLFRYSDRIVQEMTQVGGDQVFLATLPSYQTPIVRAPVLWERIVDVRKQTGASRVNLICHSLGGLDCRYLVSPGGFAADTGVDAASSVATITTVATAHQGTPVADQLLGLLPDGVQGQIANDFASLVGDWFSDAALHQDASLRASIQALSTPQAAAFNASIVDAPGIYYQSWAGYSRPFGQSTAEHDARLRELCVPTEKTRATVCPASACRITWRSRSCRSST